MPGVASVWGSRRWTRRDRPHRRVAGGGQRGAERRRALALPLLHDRPGRRRQGADRHPAGQRDPADAVHAAFGASTAHCNPANKLVPQTATNPSGLYPSPTRSRTCSCWADPLEACRGQGGGPPTTSSARPSSRPASTPISLCLPTWKDTIAAVGMPSNRQPRGARPLHLLPGDRDRRRLRFVPRQLVRAEDEFSAPRFVPTQAGAREPCSAFRRSRSSRPASRRPRCRVPWTRASCASRPRRRPFWRLVFDQNQFGSSVSTQRPEDRAVLPPVEHPVQPVGPAG